MIEYLSKEEASKVFLQSIAVHLDEDHNFTQEDLARIANGFIAAAAPKLIKEERDQCIKFVNSLNHYVGKALDRKRNNLG